MYNDITYTYVQCYILRYSILTILHRSIHESNDVLGMYGGKCSNIEFRSQAVGCMGCLCLSLWYCVLESSLAVK